MRALHWIGSLLEDIRLFPPSVRIQAGTDLRLVQQGLPPRDWKPMTTVGRGVREIRIHSRDGAFRILYVVVTDSDVYVLHVFRK